MCYNIVYEDQKYETYRSNESKIMQVLLAKVSGFCGDGGKFGVSGAIRLAQEAALSNPGHVYIVGDLVHNTHVTDWLEESYGIHFVKKLSQVPDKATLVIKAHGAPPSFCAECVAKNLHVVDATCPMVKAAQQMVKKYIDEGKQIIYVASSPAHDEAISVSKQVERGVQVVTIDQLADLEIKNPLQTVVMTQTTLSILETKKAFANLQKKYPDLEIRPHLCQATTKRQEAVLELSKQVDLLIVVGAPHSSNSRRLLEVASTSGKPAYAVDEAEELDPAWFNKQIYRVGVIAGASTPEWITQEVVAKIKSITN